MLMRILAMVCAVLLATPVYAGSKIDLVQSDGSIVPQGGESDAAKVTQATTTSCEDQNNSVCRVEFQFEYETVAASQTNQVLGGTGAVGDLIHSVKCVATGASAAVVTLKDGAGTAFNIFPILAAAGTVQIDLDILSTLGAWQITTSTNMTCVGIGRFS